ncbi:MAG: SDR family oxidoreductase [Phycisphaerales bacterium]|nr:SDR family oxidoreductase [Phycisphaerales bacterium]
MTPPHPAISALITGGTRRVGLAIARAFANHRRGSHLILTTREVGPDANSAKRELESLGATVAIERLDPGDLTAVEAFTQSLGRSQSSLDALVLNASSYDETPLDEIRAADLDRHMRVNAFGPALLARGLSSLLAKSTYSHGAGIVAMADMHVLGRPRKNLLAYSMSKAALVEAVRTLARELAPRVRVNAVAPGVIEWPTSGPDADPDFQAAYLKRVPLSRAGSAADAAEAVRWLALDASYTTGEILRVDGGRWLA